MTCEIKQGGKAWSHLIHLDEKFLHRCQEESPLFLSSRHEHMQEIFIPVDAD